MSAIFSPDKKYRYKLTRSTGSMLRWHRPCLFVMLNPSIADDVEDDPTIRRCIGFAKREGMTTITVVNLFAFVATDPEELYGELDPVGPENDKYLIAEIEQHKNNLIIAAWGNHKVARMRAKSISLFKEASEWHCLGRNKNGSPKHPLYLPGDIPLEVF